MIASSDESKVLETFTLEERELAERVNTLSSSGTTFYVLDDGHNVVNVQLGTWLMWFEHYPAKREVARDAWLHIRVGRVAVTTIFRGHNHTFSSPFPDSHTEPVPGEVSPRLMFETMVFWGMRRVRNGRAVRRVAKNHYQRRYLNYEDAVRGHEEVVKLTRAYLAGHPIADGFYDD